MRLKINKVRCKCCGSIIESKDLEDVQTCMCGAISLSGGLYYQHIHGGIENVINLAEYEEGDGHCEEICEGKWVRKCCDTYKSHYRFGRLRYMRD